MIHRFPDRPDDRKYDYGPYTVDAIKNREPVDSRIALKNEFEAEDALRFFCSAFKKETALRCLDIIKSYFESGAKLDLNITDSPKDNPLASICRILSQIPSNRAIYLIERQKKTYV